MINFSRFLNKFEIYILFQKVWERKEKPLLFKHRFNSNIKLFFSIDELFKVLKLSDLSELSKLLNNYSKNRTRVIRMSQFQS